VRVPEPIASLVAALAEFCLDDRALDEWTEEDVFGYLAESLATANDPADLIASGRRSVAFILEWYCRHPEAA
jgi:hypothetical protein